MAARRVVMAGVLHEMVIHETQVHRSLAYDGGMASGAEPDNDQLTIDELARETGMTVRNIRAHQSRGLLPAPEVRARTGFYGPEHVARLRLIQDMQAEGFNLKGIERLLQNNGSSEAILDFGRALMGAFVEESPELTTAAEL